MPPRVLALALLAAVVHMGPFWYAQSQTPPGWTFTGNMTGSPDALQYRVWMRQGEAVVENKFTVEPNNPHLPVFLYFAVAKAAAWAGMEPEFVYAYAGAFVAFVFTLLLYVTIRRFLGSPYRAWWVLLALLIGGGLGAHLKILAQLDFVRASPILASLIVEPLKTFYTAFDDYRGAYIVVALLDTHYLFVWLVTTASVLSLFFTLRDFAWWRVSLTAALYGLATLLHVYEALTLMAIATAVVLLCWHAGLVRRHGALTLAACAITVGLCLGGLALLYRSSGLPLPNWRAPTVAFSSVLLAYPLAWGLMAWGIGRYWRTAGFNERFLLGWALGCLALVLAGPFYPYPDRGTMTLQIPLYIVAAAIYFSQRARVTPLAAGVALLLLAATPMLLLVKTWVAFGSPADHPYVYLSPAHRELVDVLRQNASSADVLLVDKADVPWKTDDLWLAPDYPGRLYCGHFFLTVDYDRKCAEASRFFQSGPQDQAAFLRQEKVRFVYVAANQNPARFATVPDLAVVKAASVGSLFEYAPARTP